jgi:hypothetical protein
MIFATTDCGGFRQTAIIRIVGNAPGGGNPAPPTLVELTGQVVRLGDGSPLAGAVVRLYDGDWFIAETYTDADGNYRLPGLTPGSDLRLVIAHDSYPTITIDGLAVEVDTAMPPFGVGHSAATAADIAYAHNLGLKEGEVYLRKLAEMLYYRFNLAEDGLTMDDILQWDEDALTATLNLFGETFVFAEDVAAIPRTANVGGSLRLEQERSAIEPSARLEISVQDAMENLWSRG